VIVPVIVAALTDVIWVAVMPPLMRFAAMLPVIADPFTEVIWVAVMPPVMLVALTDEI
jgi:hypothetical protein